MYKLSDWTRILNELLNLEAGLTAWEVEFLESLERQADRREDFVPTDRQFDTLCRIYDQRA